MNVEPPKPLARAPRRVPFSTRLQVLFGGLTSKIGWPIFGLGMLFFWVFSHRSALMDVGQFNTRLEVGSGRVSKVRATGAIVNGQPMRQFHYAFWTPAGLFRGTSFGYPNYRPGVQVQVEYDPADPAVNRIAGLSTSEYGLAIGLLPLVVPVLGAVMIFLGVAGGGKTLRLLTNGRAAYGILVEKKATARQVNEQIVYELKFQFRAHNGKRYQVTTYTHETMVLEDEEREIVLYRESNPRNAMMLDNMPGNPEITETGEIKSKGSSVTAVNLLVPAVAILGNLAYIVYLLGR